MITLNLLSPWKKKELKQTMFLIMFKNIVAYCLITSIAATIILLFSKMILQNNFNNVVIEGALITKEYGDLNQKIRKLNRELKHILAIQEEQEFWSEKLIHFTELVPAEIEITFFSADKNGDARVNGIANRRENLLTFQENLDASPIFNEINLPISYLLEPENISFEITAKLKPRQKIQN